MTMFVIAFPVVHISSNIRKTRRNPSDSQLWRSWNKHSHVEAENHDNGPDWDCNGITCQLVAIGVVNWQIANIDDLCDPKQPQRFTCPGPRTYYSASITWGVIGPKRMFNGLYPILQWCFLIGALVIIPFYFAKRYLPKYFRFVNPVLIIGGMASWAPYNLSYITPGFYLSIIFMYFIYLAWWEKYNYVLSSALDAGVTFSAIIIFFAVNYHPKVELVGQYCIVYRMQASTVVWDSRFCWKCLRLDTLDPSRDIIPDFGHLLD